MKKKGTKGNCRFFLVLKGRHRSETDRSAQSSTVYDLEGLTICYARTMPKEIESGQQGRGSQDISKVHEMYEQDGVKVVLLAWLIQQ